MEKLLLHFTTNASNATWRTINASIAARINIDVRKCQVYFSSLQCDTHARTHTRYIDFDLYSIFIFYCLVYRMRFERHFNLFVDTKWICGMRHGQRFHRKLIATYLHYDKSPNPLHCIYCHLYLFTHSKIQLQHVYPVDTIHCSGVHV